ncbi:MAG: type II toxin-antitoxin system RelE/ParE family toxin [Candidatus Brocadia sp. AMX2]|nr:MAG: type II toxin-antitoxin system RelE/ParE family toxin [Candidatus Brocadia sp. AMX2]MBC6933761.1 type II toxin-antitoxin system RelE/ParE family toxin [Candidatus Brocadia sp.]MBL1170124.1 type II toxin-antitoxin system RelE/ParE family toxin [Candidatus Brocadia sp. AMX1]NOG43069.1 type II toxin-antitoxin system RelE/ParE family toxin [Planctomycetota bacterium]NUO05857.1 type II toxin-antitoxin system RelE/ParE family toxin [Candidatus Brocadia sinica]
MDPEIEWSPTARLDFRDIILFIAENNPLAANPFRNKILNHIKQLPKICYFICYSFCSRSVTS